MLVQPKFSLKTIIIEGVSVILNGEEARELKKKYPLAAIKNLRKRRQNAAKNGECVSISPQEYMRGLT